MIENIGAYSQVDYDRGYQQGRADALNEKNCKECYSKCLDCDKRIKAYKEGKEEADQFLKQWKDDVMNSLCKYDANSVEEVYQLGINRGRADAIEEFADTMQLVKLTECDDVPRELIEAIEKQIGICALIVKEKMLKEHKDV